MEPQSYPTASTTTQTKDPGLGRGIASLVASVLGFGLFGVIFGIIGVSSSKRVHKVNVPGIIGIVWGVVSTLVVGLMIVVLMAVPVLQRNQRDVLATNTLYGLRDELEIYRSAYGYGKYPDMVDESTVNTSVLFDVSGGMIMNSSPQQNEQSASQRTEVNDVVRYVYTPYDCDTDGCSGYVAGMYLEGKEPLIIASE